MVERENLELRSMIITTLHYASGERVERSFLEVKLAMAREWALKPQELLRKL